MIKYCGRWKFCEKSLLVDTLLGSWEKICPMQIPITKYQAVKPQNVLSHKLGTFFYEFLLKFEEIKIWRKLWKYFVFIFGAGFWPVFFI
jgi:hypothetical protein